MSRGTRRHLVQTLCVAVLVASAGACASIPTSGGVMESSAEVDSVSDLGFDVQGPATDAGPEQIVQGFVSAAQFGPASAATFDIAREYTTPVAWSAWDEYTQVLVLSEYPRWTVGEFDDSTAVTSVQGEATVVASLDESGVYTELAEPSVVDVTFDLARGTDGQWRISGLEDGLLVLADFLGNAFHRTPLYYPTPDREWWVPDVRWFPGQSWRTAATQAILDGPPERLAQSAVSVVPDGATLAIDAVTVAENGTIDVSLTSAISSAPPEDRALLVAQLEATLREGDGRTVVLSAGTSPLAATSAAEPSRPVTVGDAVAVLGAGSEEGQVLRRVVGRELTDPAVPPDLAGLDVTAVAVGTDDATVVVRDGAGRLVRLGEDGRSELLVGRRVAPPSIDRFDAVWTAVGGELRVVLPAGGVVPVEPEWLADLPVRSLRVAPEGARIALVTDSPDGPEVWVAAIERDADEVPTGLSTPVRVGGPVDSVEAVEWSEESTLTLLGRDPDGARGLFVAGVGGLASSNDGLTRPLATTAVPTAVAAGVGASPTLVLDADGTLHVRQSAALWPVVSEDVVAVAYPG
ncbi:LpqB family beta-propeller domain-containing protein [Isoptericola sp. S6320L]|uniref:LpqB family beta-propeller domain-containing protein n=1 Tax=Isoptericola sp. S6320L TaxID=2926411 RepID=UPI001FF2A056|nr:LpqB family beta-propeller domain-containing protein [Isoptericola sp. S6320L]MCK0118705.1 LpqB family beta-propeller domain-containing protein [Isoptericola sp. S6320L]